MGNYTSAMLREFRKKSGLTQEQVVANARGVSRATLAGIEKGHAFVRLETLQLLAQGMKLPRRETLELVRCWIRDTIGEELWAQFSVRLKGR